MQSAWKFVTSPLIPVFRTHGPFSLSCYDRSQRLVSPMEILGQPIPTKRRTSISKDLSYPLKNAEISNVLWGVPQYEQLSVRFDPHYNLSRGNPHHRYEDPPTVELFCAGMTHIRVGISSDNLHIAAGEYDEQWHLQVYPCRREIRPIAHELLIEEGLPRIRRWLEQPRTETWLSGRKFCRIFLHQAEHLLSFQED